MFDFIIIFTTVKHPNKGAVDCSIVDFEMWSKCIILRKIFRLSAERIMFDMFQ